MCRVLNKRKTGVPAGAIYIGRGSKWGNPFRIGPDGDRASVIAKYERWLRDQHHLLRGSTNCAAMTSSASARRSHVMAISCCGSPTYPAKTNRVVARSNRPWAMAVRLGRAPNSVRM